MAGQLTIDTLKASTGVLATQNGMTGIAKAWVNWTGSTAVIRASYNVSSVTRNATGDYTINFSTAMVDTNYCVSFNSSPLYATAFGLEPAMATTTNSLTEVAPTTTAFRLQCAVGGGSAYDPKYAYFVAHGN